MQGHAHHQSVVRLRRLRKPKQCSFVLLQPSDGLQMSQEAYDWHNEATFNETWSMLQKCEVGLGFLEKRLHSKGSGECLWGFTEREVSRRARELQVFPSFVFRL